MKMNWITTVATGAIALSLAAGSGAYAQMGDSHRHEAGPGGQGPSMARPDMSRSEPGHSAAGEQRSLGERSEHAAGSAMHEHAETDRTHEMAADRAEAERRHDGHDATQTIGQSGERAGRGDRALSNGAAEQRLDRSRAGHDARQPSEPGREQGKTADIKQNKPGETSKSAESGRQGRDDGRGRIGRNERQPANQTGQKDKLTGQNQEQHGSSSEHASRDQQERNKQAEQGSQPRATTTQQQATRPAPGQTTGEARQHEGTGQAQNREEQSREGIGAARAQNGAREMQNGSNPRAQAVSTKINNNQRTQVLDRLRSSRDLERARADVNVRVDVGERLPDRVRPLPLPPDIVDLVPEYRGYDYTVIHDEVAIINPESREVVDVIPERGFAAEGGSYGSYAASGRIELSREQREILRRAAVSSATTVGSSGAACLTLRPVPEELARNRPELASDKYLAIGDQVVLVDPHDQKIVQVINPGD